MISKGRHIRHKLPTLAMHVDVLDIVNIGYGRADWVYEYHLSMANYIPQEIMIFVQQEVKHHDP